MTLRNSILTIIITLLSAVFSAAFAQINIEPYGFAINVDDGGELTLNINNQSNTPVGFQFRARLNREQNNQARGPRRDDPGDVLGEFPMPGGAAQHYNVGLAWDEENRWMWNNDFHNGTCSALDPADNYRAARQFNVEARCMSIGLLRGHLYMVVDPQRYLTHYDRAGNRLNNVQFGFVTFAVTASPELDLLFVMGDDNNIHVYTTRDDGQMNQEVGRIPNWQGFIANTPCRSMLWVDLHPDGQLWLNSTRGPNGEQGNWAWEVAVNTDRWECTQRVQVFCTRAGQSPQHWDGIGHDGENLWCSFWMIAQGFIIDDGIAEATILAFDPREGVVDPGADADIFILIDPEGAEPGVYNFNVESILTQGNVVTQRVFSAVVSIDSPTADVVGVVSNAENNQPVGGAQIQMNRYTIQRRSDNAGRYRYNDLPMGAYQLTFTAPDFLPLTLPVELEEAGEVVLNAPLLHADCGLSEDEIVRSLPPDDETRVEFNAANEGNGTLVYRTERRLIGEANADPWTLRRSIMVSELLNDARVGGVAFAGDNYYVARAAEGRKLITVLNREGERVREFAQRCAAPYGYADLAWDGELIWGSGERDVFGLTTEGELMHQWRGQANPCNNLTWDSDREVLWTCGTTTDPVAFTREGEVVLTLRRRGFRIYGLAYYPDDPDGYNLYILHNPSGATQFLHKMNIATNDTLFVADLTDNPGGRPSGAEITSELDVYSWVMLALANNGANDRIDLWQVDARKEWMQLEPTEGQIAADGSQDFILTLNSTGLPAEVRFNGEIAFIHNGVGGETVLPIQLNVSGVGRVVRTLNFAQGWNMVSLNCDPEEHGIIPLFQPLAAENLLVMVKDGQGRFYRPEWGFCNIPGWVVSEGYQARVSQACQLNVAGQAAPPDQPIDLVRGWQIVAYYPRVAVTAPVAFAGIVEQMEMAKDVAGHFYLPAWGFNNMEPLREGQGYQVKMIEAAQLVWNLEENANVNANVNDSGAGVSPAYSGAGVSPAHSGAGVSPAYSGAGVSPAHSGAGVSPAHSGASVSPACSGAGVSPAYSGAGVSPAHSGAGVSPAITVSEENMSLLVLSDQSLNGAINVYAGDRLVGTGDLSLGAAGIAVWGGESGAQPRQALTLKLHTADGKAALLPTTLQGKGIYEKDGLWVVKLTSDDLSPNGFGITEISPNPFNGLTTVHYHLSEAGQVKLVITDLAGREVDELIKGNAPAGQHRVSWEAAGLPSGLYIVRLESGGTMQSRKVMLVK